MAGESEYLLTSTGNLWNAVGDRVRGDGWYGNTTGQHTVSITVHDLIGRIYIEGALAAEPADADWFPINFSNNSTYYIQYPQNPSQPTGLNGGDRGISVYTFTGNFTWIRARLDRSYITTTPPQQDVSTYYGSVSKILINQ